MSIEAGVHICLRNVAAGSQAAVRHFDITLARSCLSLTCTVCILSAQIYRELADRGVTHLCGAPIVMQMLVNATPDEKRVPAAETVEFMTAAAPPPASVLAAMDNLGFNVTHVYGLTEIYGPAVINEWHSEWDALDADAKAEKRSRQGVKYSVLEELDVLDPVSMQPVPRDGITIGEVMCKVI
eukprot:SAG31_NODE_7723_length_1608_cov_2.069583_2_plen_183_part_00